MGALRRLYAKFRYGRASRRLAALGADLDRAMAAYRAAKDRRDTRAQHEASKAARDARTAYLSALMQMRGA